MTFILKEEERGVDHRKDGSISSANLKTGWNLSQGLNMLMIMYKYTFRTRFTKYDWMMRTVFVARMAKMRGAYRI
jgi:hypothetical protein